MHKKGPEFSHHYIWLHVPAVALESKVRCFFRGSKLQIVASFSSSRMTSTGLDSPLRWSTRRPHELAGAEVGWTQESRILSRETLKGASNMGVLQFRELAHVAPFMPSLQHRCQRARFCKVRLKTAKKSSLQGVYTTHYSLVSFACCVARQSSMAVML